MNGNAIELTAEVVTAFLSHNPTSISDLPGLIRAVHRALTGAAIDDGGAGGNTLTSSQPAVPIRRSITAEYLVCLEDGKKLKSLKRHLKAEHSLDPTSYRQKWGLKEDYPMVAPNYSEARSTLAKAMGLGGGAKRRATGSPEPIEAPTKPKRRAKTR